MTNSTGTPTKASFKTPGPKQRDFRALVFKKYWNGIQVVVKSPPAIEIYTTHSFGPKSSKLGVWQ